MERIILDPKSEKLMQDFQAALETVTSPDDLFPPDYPEDGVREPRNPIIPPIIGCECIKLAKVYDLEQSRARLLGRSTMLVDRINELLPA